MNIAIAVERLDSSSDLLAWLFGALKDPSDRETDHIAAVNSLSRTPLWRKHLEMYPGTHTKTPKGNLSREVAFRNVGKDLSDSNPRDSFVPTHRSNDFRQLVLFRLVARNWNKHVKLTIRLSTTKPQLLEFHSYTAQICEPEVRFSSILFLNLVGKIGVYSETSNLKNVRRL